MLEVVTADASGGGDDEVERGEPDVDGAVDEWDDSADGSDAESDHSAQQRRDRLFDAASAQGAIADNGTGSEFDARQKEAGDQVEAQKVGGFGVPWRAPGPPKLCINECGRAANTQRAYHEPGICCVKCEVTGTAEHAGHCNRFNGMDDDQDDEANDRGDDETDRTLFIPPPQHNTPPPGFADDSRGRGGTNGGDEPDDPPAAWAGGTPPRRTQFPSSTKATLDEEPSASGEGGRRPQLNLRPHHRSRISHPHRGWRSSVRTALFLLNSWMRADHRPSSVGSRRRRAPELVLPALR